MQQSIIVQPCDLEGSVSVPLSKSLLHRSLICAAMAGDLTLCDLGEDVLSDDIYATKDCITAIMAAQKDSLFGRAHSADEPYYFACKESGSTLRFMIPLAAALGIPAHYEGDGRLPLRPLKEYTEIFDKKGVRMDFPGQNRYLPLLVTGQLLAGKFLVPGNISSQYISGLLMALPLLEGDSDINLTTMLESEPYVEMTRDVMRAFGVEVEKLSFGYHIAGGQKYARSTPYRAEPDFSQAAFWLTAQYLGHNVSVKNLPEKSSQGDREIQVLLKKLQQASNFPQEKNADAVVADVSQYPDLVPILAVAAAAAGCVTRITHAERLRLKECDRLQATCDMLTSLGVKNTPTSDGLIIAGRPGNSSKHFFKACSIDSYHDHRMVMASAIAATRADGPVCISDYRAVDKSYPEFFRNFRTAGGIADELNVGK